MANKPHEFPKFTSLDQETIQKLMSKIPQYLQNAAAKTEKKVNVTRDLLNNTIYAFRYRDLSKEAIMALGESLLY